jgi:hypothetical protein
MHLEIPMPKFHRMVRRWSLALCLPLAGACGYTAPVDSDADTVLNGISGTIVLGVDEPVDDVLVFLYDVNDPPAPEGLGRPVTFATVPASAFTGDAAGMQAAPFAVTEVPDGSFIVSAVMDVDDDFFPLLTSNSGPTCGDWRGAHLTNIVTQEIAPVIVSGGQLVDEVTVVIAAEYTTERPAYVYADNSVEMGFLLEESVDFGRLSELEFGITSTGIDSDLLRLAGPDEATAECTTGFVVLVEPGPDGLPAPHWVYGSIEVPEENLAAAYLQTNASAVWPRVIAVYTGKGDVELAEGEQYVSEAVHNPRTVDAEWPVGTVFPVSSLNMTFVPGVQHIRPDGTSELLLDPTAVPQGEWSVTVLSVTGQAWTLPNEVADYPVTSDDFDRETQGARLQVAL